VWPIIPEAPAGVRVEHIASFEVGLRRAELYRLTGVEGDLAERLYGLLAPDPDRLTGDFAALGAWLDAQDQAGDVLVLPDDHATALAARTRLPVEGLRLAHWPPDAARIARLLDRRGAGFQDEARFVQIVLVDEARVDPHRALLTALQQRLYRLDGAWFGLLHALVYVTGPEAPPTPSHTVFQGGITLDAAVIDPAPAPGSPLRLYLRWQTPAAVLDPYVVFVHVVDGSGAIVAQADSEPGGGLLPMTIWQPGQPITDRLAVALPADLLPGVYEVRIGVYHPASLLRLPALAGQGGGDYVLVGLATVAASGP
jgi:hypothetical protein